MPTPPGKDWELSHTPQMEYIPPNRWRMMHPFKVGFFVALGALAAWGIVVAGFIILALIIQGGDNAGTTGY